MKNVNDLFKILGFATEVEKERIGGDIYWAKYWRNDLINNNYLVVLTGFLQYKLYTSDFSKSAFSVSN
jgi:hypothetical protein